MKKRYWFLIIILVLFLLIFLRALTSNATSSTTVIEDTGINWAEIRANDVAITSAEWGTSKLFELSSPGWEEGYYISLDGNEFYFIYTQIDMFAYLTGKTNVVGPQRDKSNQCTHPELLTPHTCGGLIEPLPFLKIPRADQFYSTFRNGKWSEPIPHPLTRDYPIGGITLVGKNKAYFMSGFQDEESDIEDIGYAEKINGVWGEKIKIEAVSSLKYSDSDPYVNQADDEMFFWSTRPAKFGKKNIYRSVKVNGVWGEPELLNAPINTDKDDMMTLLVGNYLYFASNQGNPNKLAIWKSLRLGDNEWGTPELVISSKVGVGEPAMAADGKRLYFEQIFTDNRGNFNPEIMYVDRVG